MAVGEKSDVSDPVEAVGDGVLKEAADEFVGREPHDLGFAVLAIVLPGEADLAVVEPDQAAVGDGDAVRISPDIVEHLSRSGERRLGVDDPVDLGQSFQPSGEGGGVGRSCERPGKAKFVGSEGGVKLFEEQVAELAGKHAHRQEETRLAGPGYHVARNYSA